MKNKIENIFTGLLIVVNFLVQLEWVHSN